MRARRAATGSSSSLAPGRYEAFAACPRRRVCSGARGGGLRILAAPDTATIAAPAIGRATDANPWLGLAIALAAAVGTGAWVHREDAKR
jgi:hypothetical protein